MSVRALTLLEPGFGAGGNRIRAFRHIRAVLKELQTGLLTFDRDLVVLFVSDRATSLLAAPESVPDRSATLLQLLRASAVLDQDAGRELHDACLRAVATGDPESVSVCFGADPHTLVMQVTRLEDGNYLASLEDETVRLAAEATAVKLAMCDPLTGLPNRGLFRDQVTATLTRPARPLLAMMLIDLDRFKAVNDTLGHPIGDALLRLVANRLRSILRVDDTLARLGGDEFALLVTAAPDHDVLAAMARRIVDVVGRSYLIDGQLVNIGASVGIALAPQDGAEHDQLLRNADLALYHAKSAGRGTYSFFETEMDVRAVGRRTMELDLRKALPLREFELYYQPQIDLETNMVIGFEALVRWHHPGRGVISPGDFIPLAEEIGMIIPLGEWVIREACFQAARWPTRVSVAVNVSPHQFGDTARLVDTVSKALATSGLPGHRLEIEITESVLLCDKGAVLDALHRLRGMGVRVAMDDFGTGYSSLSQLHSFPFDKIKIDRSFVTDRGDVAGQNAIIRAITALGASLGMATIAEGVETSEQLDRIRSEGCTSVQGYLFSRPVPIDQVDAIIANRANPGCIS